MMSRGMLRRTTTALGAVALLATWIAGHADAQTYPQKPIRMIVPFPPGGVADIAARVVGQKLSEKWQQQVIVENRTGASGMVGVELAARAAPDGYTVLVTPGDFATIYPYAYANLAYDPDRDFVPIAIITKTPLVFVTNPASGFSNIKQLIVAAQAHPGEIAFASPGTGATNHLVGELFAADVGVKLLHVPYRGGAPAAAAVAGGEVPLGVIAISSALPFVSGNKMGVLGVTSANRVPLVPDWPTLAEGGVPGFDAALWVGMWGPSAMPTAIVGKLHDEIGRIVKEEDVRHRFGMLGAEAIEMSPDQLRALIRRDAQSFAKVVKQAGIHIE